VAIVTVVIAASLTGRVLKLAIAHDGPHPAIDNLNDRIQAWWGIVLLVALAYLAGRTGLSLLFALCAVLALREFIGVAGKARRLLPAEPIACWIVLPLQYVLFSLDANRLYSFGLVPLYALVVLPVMHKVGGNDLAASMQLRRLQQGLMICGFCFSHAAALLTLKVSGQTDNRLMLLFLLVVVQSSDVAQYIWGKLAGRRLIAPAVSPSKTLEGTLGGMLTATAIGAALAWMTPFTVAQAAACSMALTVAGFGGGILMSALKRERGIKDWGNTIKGHGGVLDRIDSLCFSAPLFFYVLYFGWSN